MQNNLSSKNKHVSLFLNNTCNMTTKLTLTINDEVIRTAKNYARLKEKSLSSLVENYLKSLDATTEKKSKLSPEIMKLKGKLKLPRNRPEKIFQMLNLYLPSILVPLVGLVFPGIAMAALFLYIEKEELS